MVVVTVDEGSEFVSLKVNGEEKKGNCMPNPFRPRTYSLILDPITSDTHIVADFGGQKPQPSDKCTVTFSATPATSGSVRVVPTGGTEIQSGDQVEEGATLGVTISVNPGNEIASVLVNNVEMKDQCEDIWFDGTVFGLTLPDITEDTDIKIEFSKIQTKHTLTYSYDAKLGDVTVQVPGQGYLNSGDQFVEGSNLNFAIYVNDGSVLTSVLVNDVEKKDECDYMTWGGYYELTLNNVTEDVNVAVTLADETGIADAVLAEAAYNGATQMLNIPAGATAAVYSAAGQQVMSVEGGQTVSTANLATGAYLVRVATEAGVKVIKFIQK